MTQFEKWKNQMRQTIFQHPSIFVWCILALISNVCQAVYLKKAGRILPQ